MQDAQHQLLKLMAVKGEHSRAIADAVCQLVGEGAELGALTEIPAVDHDGNARSIRVLPLPWMARLVRAAEVGAFERMDVGAIVDRIIGTPLPAHLENESV